MRGWGVVEGARDGVQVSADVNPAISGVISLSQRARHPPPPPLSPTDSIITAAVVGCYQHDAAAAAAGTEKLLVNKLLEKVFVLRGCWLMGFVGNRVKGSSCQWEMMGERI